MGETTHLGSSQGSLGPMLTLSSKESQAQWAAPRGFCVLQMLPMLLEQTPPQALPCPALPVCAERVSASQLRPTCQDECSHLRMLVW